MVRSPLSPVGCDGLSIATLDPVHPPSPSVESPPHQVDQPAAKDSLDSSRQVDPNPP